MTELGVAPLVVIGIGLDGPAGLGPEALAHSQHGGILLWQPAAPLLA